MIRVYDFDYNLLCETDKVFSSEWELKFNGIGTYEGSFPINSEMASVFAGNRHLVLCEEDRQAICVGKLISGKVQVYGRTPEWLLSKRIVLPFKTSEIFGSEYTDPETVLLYLLDSAYKTPSLIDSDGNVSSGINEAAVAEDFVIPEAIGTDSFDRHFWRNGANELSEVVADLCDIMGCGHSLIFVPEERCWKFSLVFGEEKKLLISKSLKNAYDMSMKDSLLDSAEGGYFEIYTSEDEDNLYGYKRTDNAEGTGMLYWDSVLSSASGLSEAEQLLREKSGEVRLECELMGIEYGTDYKLGDTLRVQFEAGPFRRTLKRRVTGVSIISSSKGNSVKPTFSEL
ncbi:MAG: hypothetical protein IJ366_08390 [Clostridia bacterium]|nr:hypothetical protein [Clostridia bacterium]